MSGRDGLGPMGAGPGTGRGLGTCGKGLAVGTAIGYGCRMYSRNRGKGFRGLGVRSNLSLEEEKNLLEERLNQIKDLMGQ